MQTNKTSVVTSNTTGLKSVLARLKPEELELLHIQLAKGCSDDELAYGLTVAEHLKLNVFARQLYMIKYEGKNPRMVLIIGIDGYRSIAAREQDARGYQTYAGSDPAKFGERIPDSDTVLGWHPDSATVTVYKMIGNNRVPFTQTVYWEGRARYDFNKLGERWRADPRGMLAKTSEVAALRAAFPSQMEPLIQHDDDAIQADYTVMSPRPIGAPVEPPYPADSLYTPPPPTAPQAPTITASIPADVAGYLDVCPTHNVAFLGSTDPRSRQIYYRHKTGETKEVKGATKPVWCYRATVLKQFLSDEIGRLGMEPGIAAAYVRDNIGVGIADLIDEQNLQAVSLLRAFAPSPVPPESAVTEPDDATDDDLESLAADIEP